MKKYMIILSILLTFSYTSEIILSEEQEKNWQITLEKPKLFEYLPLGGFVAEVVTPPTLLHTVSLPFEANVKTLNVAQYQMVHKGDILAKVTGTEWIAIQQQAISEAIEFKHHSHLTERKNLLCEEDIIPKKECIAANAELRADKIRVVASKALLKSYGASNTMIDTLFNQLILSPTLDVKSDVEGSIIVLNAAPGKSATTGDALFVIQKQGSLWLETNIEAKRTKNLQEGQEVSIKIYGTTFQSRILQISPVINRENQTRQVRFVIPKEVNIVAGLRESAQIFIVSKSMRIHKTSVIKDGKKQIVFVKSSKGYRDVPIEILSEDDEAYYIKINPEIVGTIASSSVAILKNMLGEGDE